MADKRDYYEVLGISKGASDDEIKKAYRKMAKENHPDLHPGDKMAEERFKEISEAYEVLSDSDKKARYDQFGHAGVDPNYGAGAGSYGGFGGFGDMDFDLGSIFDMFTGGSQSSARRRNAPQRGESRYLDARISFEEAAFGCEREINFSRIENCETCSGSGCEPGTTPEVCSQCGGSGSVRTQQRTPLGSFTSTSPCSRCSGTGRIIHSPCKDCRGSGQLRKNRKVTVKIPAGIDDGQRVSLRGQGDAGKNGGPAGDVFVTVSIKPHDVFERDGTSVFTEIPISFTQAALGCELQVQTLDGRVKYSIPEGTQTGTTFRLKGKGIPYLNGKGRGDQYVTVTVEVPKSLNSEQKELLRKYAEAMGEGDTEREGFFDKLKKKK